MKRPRLCQQATGHRFLDPGKDEQGCSLGCSFQSLQHPLAEPQGKDGHPGERHGEVSSCIARAGFGASNNVPQLRSYTTWPGRAKIANTLMPTRWCCVWGATPCAPERKRQTSNQPGIWGLHYHSLLCWRCPGWPWASICKFLTVQCCRSRACIQSGVTGLAELLPSFSPFPGLSHHNQSLRCSFTPSQRKYSDKIWLPRLRFFPGLCYVLA